MIASPFVQRFLTASNRTSTQWNYDKKVELFKFEPFLFILSNNNLINEEIYRNNEFMIKQNQRYWLADNNTDKYKLFGV